MNTKFLFAKLAGLVVLVAALFVAVPVARQRLMVKPQAAVPNATPTTQPVQSQAIPSIKLIEAKPHAVSLPIRSPLNAPAVPEPQGPDQDTSANQNQQAPPDAAPEPDPEPQPQQEVLSSVEGALATHYWILPGQELDLTDYDYSWIHVSASFPIAFQAGRCQATQTEKISCHSIPSGGVIHLQDLRIGERSDAGNNLIDITATH